MNRINEIIAGLSFLGVLSATGYACRWVPMLHSRCSCWWHSPSVYTGYHEYEKAADGRAIPVNGKDKYYTYIIPARRREVNEN